MRITIDGKLKKGVIAKDVALYLMSKMTTSGATGYFVEYAGEAVRSLSMEGRLTLCNLSIEMGARGGMVAPDEKTFEYIKGREFAPKGEAWDKALAYWKTLKSGNDAVFDKEIHFDAADIEPMITFGTNPGMRLVQWPKSFDVIVTENMFGDILTDEASVITGSLGMLPSASIGLHTSLFEPIHGSYPQAAGKNIANPLATILSGALMFEYAFNLMKEGALIREAVAASMKTDLSSQISLTRIPQRYYRPENAFEHSVLTRLEKIPTTIYESTEEGSFAIAKEIATQIRKKQELGENFVIALPGGRSPLSVYKELIRMSIRSSRWKSSMKHVVN